jgi:hypothetical protein
MTDKKTLTAAMAPRRRSSGLPAVSGATRAVPEGESETAAEAIQRANRSVSKPYPRRVALDLTDEQLRALQLAHVEDGIPITTRVRALVLLWMSRPELAAEATELAMRDVEAARRARSQQRR